MEEMEEMEAVEINKNDSNRNINSPNNSQTVPSSPVDAQTLSQAGLSSSQEAEVEDILIATPQSDELPSQQEAHRTRIPTLTHVPKAARGQWSKFLTALSERIVWTPEAETLWTLLAIFPRCILHAGNGPRQADA
jgi:hypothetical protein